MTPHQLYTRLLDLRLTSCPWPDFTSSTARVAIAGYEGVIVGRHNGKPVNFEEAYAVVYGEELHPKKGRRRA